jgi:ferrous iron transport protein B
MEWIESGVGLLSRLLTALLPANLLRDFLLDGVIAGVGSVIVFLPNILILFFFIAIFEDTGYMARAAFLMDKIMHLIGLHGKSFIPMLMGFGCNVPAVMATRTLESEKDRILTILITPFMSCSAKLPVYIILAGSFFGARAGTVIFSIYLAGIVLSIVTGRLFRSVLLRGADAPFVMELPPYRIPMFKSLMIHMWDRSKMFLKKMTGVILIGSVVVWGLSAFPRHVDYAVDYQGRIAALEAAYDRKLATAEPEETVHILRERKERIGNLEQARQAAHAEQSYMGRLGKVLAPVFAPLGIDWRGSVALVTGFAAKEIVVSTLGILHAADEKSEVLKEALKNSGMTALSALSMMIFVLLYVPCLATVTAIRRETGSAKWMVFNIVYSTALAWVASFGVYQTGQLLGYGA